jgi:hypothetical protein
MITNVEMRCENPSLRTVIILRNSEGLTGFHHRQGTIEHIGEFSF